MQSDLPVFSLLCSPCLLKEILLYTQIILIKCFKVAFICRSLISLEFWHNIQCCSKYHTSPRTDMRCLIQRLLATYSSLNLNQNWRKFKIQFLHLAPALFQVLYSHLWLMTLPLDSTETEHLHHYIKESFALS